MPVVSERYLTVDEVAAEFRVSKRSVYRAIERRELAAVRLGSCLRVPVLALEELIRPARIVGHDHEEEAR